MTREEAGQNNFKPRVFGECGGMSRGNRLGSRQSPVHQEEDCSEARAFLLAVI
jgi:hypothetical protein